MLKVFQIKALILESIVLILSFFLLPSHSSELEENLKVSIFHLWNRNLNSIFLQVFGN